MKRRNFLRLALSAVGYGTVGPAFLYSSGNWEEQGGITENEFVHYVSPLSGDDSDIVVSTFYELPALKDGESVGLDGGALFRNRGFLEDARAENIRVGTYGSNQIVRFDLTRTLRFSEWSVAEDSVYRQTVSPTWFRSEDVRLVEEEPTTGERSVVQQAATLEEVSQVPGSSFVQATDSEWVLFYHPTHEGAFLNQSYDVLWTAYPFALSTAGAGVDKASGPIEGPGIIEWSGSFSGGVRVGTGGVLERWIFRHHGKHHLIHAGGVAKDLIFTDTFDRGSANTLQWFNGQNVSERQTAISKRCIWRETTGRPIHAHAEGAGFASGISKGDVFLSVSSPLLPYGSTDPVVIEGAYCENADIGGGVSRGKNVLLKGVLCNNWLLENGDQPTPKGDIRVEDTCTVDTGLARASNRDRRIDVTGGTHVIRERWIRDINNHMNTVSLNKCVLIQVGLTPIIFDDYILSPSDRCLFFYDSPDAEVNLDGTEESLSDLQNRTGSFQNSAYLTHEQLAAALPNWRQGDFMMAPNARCTWADGTTAATLPDGTPLTALGATRHFDRQTMQMEEGAPRQWPTPPRSTQDDEAYILDPGAWDWEQPLPRTREALGDRLIGLWTMAEDGESKELSLTGDNHLSVNGSAPSGVGQLGPMREIAASDRFYVASPTDELLGPNGLWISIAFRFDEPGQLLSARQGLQGYEITVDDQGAVGFYARRRFNTVIAANAQADLVQSNWYLLQAWVDFENGFAGIRVDGEDITVVPAPITGRIYAAGRFEVGKGMACAVGQTMVAEYGPVEADREWLYNEGAYRASSEMQNYVLGSGTSDDSLPVELASFQVHQAGNEVKLTWTTLSESYNAGFEVQRRTSQPDAQSSFGSIGFIEREGESQREKKYQFTDDDIPFDSAVLEYRLKQIDYDGSTTYSDTIIVRRRPPASARLLPPYPNPAQGQLTLRYETPREKRVLIRMYDTLGRRVATLVDAIHTGGRAVQSVNVSRYAAGIYFLQMQSGSYQSVEKISILR